jgi:hypothetical protein
MNSIDFFSEPNFLNDETIASTSKDIFYKLFPHFYRFLNARQYDHIMKITMYGDLELHCRWKKCFRKRFVVTDVIPRDGYVVQEDDRKMMKIVARFFEPAQLTKIIEWYETNKNI